MVNYIRKIAEELLQCAEEKHVGKVSQLLAGLAEESGRLDPRDFLPDAQYGFVMVRLAVKKWAGETVLTSEHCPHFKSMAKNMIQALDKYAGEGSRAETRSFAFIADSDLRPIIERDYRELSLILVPGGAWKSAVIMAGSILEAILYDLLSADPTRKAQAIANARAPKRDLTKGEWWLHDLIEVATDLGLLPQDRAKTFDQVLRDYRNFVHPKKEIKAAHPCTEAEAFMAKGALDAICNHLGSKGSP